MVLKKLLKHAFLLTACLFNIEQVVGTECPKMRPLTEICGTTRTCSKEYMILPDECSADSDCQSGESCAIIKGGEYYGK